MTDAAEYFGSAAQHRMMAQADALWPLVADQSGFNFTGRVVSTEATPGHDMINGLML